MQLSPSNNIPPELREAVNLCLAKRRERAIISTSAIIQAARASAPGCAAVTNQELADYIAERAIEAGFAISFDERELPR